MLYFFKKLIGSNFKNFGYFLLVGLLGVVAVNYLIFSISNRVVESKENQFYLYSLNVMNSIKAQFFERQADVSAFTLNPDLKKALIEKRKSQISAAKQALIQYEKLYQVYKYILLVDLNGDVVANSTESVFYSNAVRLEVKNMISLFYKTETEKEGHSTSSSFFSNFIKLVPTNTNSEVKLLQFFVDGVRNFDGKIVGFVITIADELYLKRELDLSYEFFKKLSLEKIEMFLVDESQQVFSSFCDETFKLNCEVNSNIFNGSKNIFYDANNIYSKIKFSDTRLKRAPIWTFFLKFNKVNYFNSEEKLKTLSLLLGNSALLVIILFLVYLFVQRINFQSMVAKKMMEAQENERQRIAREIHDELGQTLTAMKFHLQGKSDEDPQKLIRKMNDVKEMIDYTNDTVRRISHELHPTMIQNLGIIDSMEWKLKETEKSLDKKFDFIYSDKSLVEKLSLDFKAHLFRIFQESMNNFIKHSGGSFVHVELKVDRNLLTFLFEDNGNLQNLNKIKLSNGIGITSITERARLCQGIVNFKKSALGGLQIVFEVNINNHFKSQEEKNEEYIVS